MSTSKNVALAPIKYRRGEVGARYAGAMIAPGAGRTVVRCVSVGVVVVVALGGCAMHSSPPNPPPSSSTLAPEVVGSMPAPGAPSPSRGVRGDLTIRLVGNACGFYSDTSGGLWLKPTLQAGWTGSGPFPVAGLSFNMTTNYGKATAAGPVSSTNPFTWAIGGEPAVVWLGRTVVITVTIDPGNVVPETNESNNTATITVAMPSALPFSPSGSNPNGTILCHG